MEPETTVQVQKETWASDTTWHWTVVDRWASTSIADKTEQPRAGNTPAAHTHTPLCTTLPAVYDYESVFSDVPHFSLQLHRLRAFISYNFIKASECTIYKTAFWLKGKEYKAVQFWRTKAREEVLPRDSGTDGLHFLTKHPCVMCCQINIFICSREMKLPLS